MSKMNLLSKLFVPSQDVVSRSHKARGLNLESLEQRQLLAVDVAAALGAAAVEDVPAVLGAAEGGDMDVVLYAADEADIANSEFTTQKNVTNGEYSLLINLPGAVTNPDGATVNYAIDGVDQPQVTIADGESSAVLVGLKAGNVVTFKDNAGAEIDEVQIDAILNLRQEGNDLVFCFGQVKDADAYVMRYKLDVLPDVKGVWTVAEGVKDADTDIVTVTVNKCHFAQNVEYDYGFAISEDGAITELDADNLTVRQLSVPVFTAVADSTTSFDIDVIRADANAANYVFTARIFTPATGWTNWSAPQTLTAAINAGLIIANQDGAYSVANLPAGAIVQFKVFADGGYNAENDTFYLDSATTCRTVVLRQVQTLAAPVATVRATGTTSARVTVCHLDPRAVQNEVGVQVRQLVNGRWTDWTVAQVVNLDANNSFDITQLNAGATIQVRLVALTPNAAELRSSFAATYCCVLNQVQRLRTPVLVMNGVLDRVMYFNDDVNAAGYQVEAMLCGSKDGYVAHPELLTAEQVRNIKVEYLATALNATNPGKYYTAKLRITAVSGDPLHQNSIAYTTAVVFKGVAGAP